MDIETVIGRFREARLGRRRMAAGPRRLRASAGRSAAVRLDGEDFQALEAGLGAYWRSAAGRITAPGAAVSGSP